MNAARKKAEQSFVRLPTVDDYFHHELLVLGNGAILNNMLLNQCLYLPRKQTLKLSILCTNLDVMNNTVEVSAKESTQMYSTSSNHTLMMTSSVNT